VKEEGFSGQWDTRLPAGGDGDLQHPGKYRMVPDLIC
jgi:hypothetical protein